jgi:hypothetical protein
MSDTEAPEYTDSRVGSCIAGWKRIPPEENGSISGVESMDFRDLGLPLAPSEGVCGSMGSSHDCTVDDTDLAGGLFVYRTVWLSIPDTLCFGGGSWIANGGCFLDLKPIAFVNVLNFIVDDFLELF